MQFPLFNYYMCSDLSLEAVIDDYLERFYLRRYGRDKVKIILDKLQNSKKIRAIDNLSIQKRVVPNHIDFGSAINEIFWFMFQSNETQALAIIFAVSLWGARVNSIYNFCTPEELKVKALQIFKMYQIYGEMSEDEYKKVCG